MCAVLISHCDSAAEVGRIHRFEEQGIARSEGLRLSDTGDEGRLRADDKLREESRYA